jgi:DNA-directed RNA polymerase alpha subunit/DNA-directed RNA polymerase subunit L
MLGENYFEDEQGLHFILKDVHVSVANAIRRTILSDIPVVCIRTETSEINQCKIQTNTSRFHNEIVKQRLSCIPIHTQDIANFPNKYRLVVDVKNDTDHEMRWVTTDDFRLQDIDNEQFIDEAEVRKIFPHDSITQRPIDFLRLRPALGAAIPGEQLQLTAKFSVSTAKHNGMFNVVSKCAFHNVIDATKRENEWAERLQEFKDENRSEEEIAFERKNFDALGAFRCYKTDVQGEPNEFDFIVKSVDIYSNHEVVYYAMEILENAFKELVEHVQSQKMPIHSTLKTRDLGYTSVTLSSIDNAYDAILEGEDYTVGYLLEHFIYKEFYATKEHDHLTYIGFKKYHPHDDYSVIRMAFREGVNAELLVKEYLVSASKQISDLMHTLKLKFKR